jgi:serine/threonine protein kinase/regulator of sirC expression with transglutaminase-like and TPR domain
MLRRLFRRNNRPSKRSAPLGREFNVGDVIEQRYEIEKTRRGYMGIVYIAYDRQRRQQVVLKTFQNKFLWDEDAIARFNAEAELWMRLGSHPNIVRAYDLRTFMGKPHVVAEYVHGGPLRALIGHLGIKEAIDYAIQICWGMQHAVDQAAIMHRDLKPDNIMVTLDGQAKVTDFGLARVMPMMVQPNDRSNRQRRANGGLRAAADDVVGGTLPYMAPELLQEAAFVGPWTDIYAFGVMLYEFFTGKLPFDSMRDESLIRMHLRVAAPDPRVLKAELHPGVTHIVNHCLAKRSTDRYQSFAEVEADLQMLRNYLFGNRYSATWPDQDHAERDRMTERGLAHLDAGEYSEAHACFRNAATLDPSRAESWFNVARARLKLWQYQEGLQAADEGLRRAIRRDEFGQLYCIRGEIYTAMMMLPKAMESFDQGLSYTPNAPRLWREKGLLIQRMGLPREAQPCFEKALEYDKLDSLSWRLLADVLREQGRHKKAYDAYAEALKLDPRSALTWSRYGACQFALGRPRDAIRSYEAALKLDPDLDEASNGLREARQAVKGDKPAR